MAMGSSADTEEYSPSQEDELRTVLADLIHALPRMEAALQHSSNVLRELHRENMKFFQARGLR